MNGKQRLVIFVACLILGCLLVATKAASIGTSNSPKGSFSVTEANPLSWLFGSQFSIILPGKALQPGAYVEYNSNPYVDCGVCDIALTSSVDSYRIKVFNPNGNLIFDQLFQTNLLKCGKYGNLYFPWQIPAGAAPGRYRITSEVAVARPYGQNCIVDQDEGYFTVEGGPQCSDFSMTTLYCKDENTLCTKPSGSCSFACKQCDIMYGRGFKCHPDVQACKKTEVCGDGICDDFESATNCASDCTKCGDTFCTGGETALNCPDDCSVCGDGICNSGRENEWNCAKDCKKDAPIQVTIGGGNRGLWGAVSDFLFGPPAEEGTSQLGFLTGPGGVIGIVAFVLIAIGLFFLLTGRPRQGLVLMALGIGLLATSWITASLGWFGVK